MSPLKTTKRCTQCEASSRVFVSPVTTIKDQHSNAMLADKMDRILEILERAESEKREICEFLTHLLAPKEK